MSMQIKWQDPPEPSTGRGRQTSRERDQLVAQLKNHPGKWALILEDQKSSSAATSMRKRGCEARSVRHRKTNTYDVYARWPEQDLADVDPYIARRRARGVPEDGRAVSRPPAPGIRAVS